MKKVENILKKGVNCQDVLDARRAAFIVDGEAYYAALHESFQQARRTIFLVGWDLHSDTRLVRGGNTSGYPTKLGEFLDALVSEKEQLHVYLLNWDFAMIYTLEREFFPRYKLKWRTRKNIHFHLDGAHPAGASQHQKIVVVDDAVAFVGGFDLSKWRWDTRAHKPDDDRRMDPDGKPYPPFHDIQMAVQGPAAEMLGQWARERWSRATGEEDIAAAPAERTDAWPASLEPDLERVKVAVALTLPAYKDREPVREIEQLYLDSIAAAQQTIYFENQYLSSHRIGQALKKRLEDADGPEVVMVLPKETGGWLEQHTMDVLRWRILCDLRDSDRWGRLRTYYPRISKDPECTLMVHAKVMVIDDNWVRVGSSNLSNRSMGLDSECDLAIAANGRDDVRKAIVRFRNQLIAEHLDCDIEDVAAAIEKKRSLIKAVESLSEGDRRLVVLKGEIPSEVDEVVPESELLDPEKPLEPDELVNYFIGSREQQSAYYHIQKILLLVAGALILAVLWRWTPAREWVDVQSAKAAGEWIRQQPFTPLMVMTAYVLGGLAAFPITLMVIASVIVFGPWWGLGYALAGAELSALVVFGIGRLLGRDAVRRVAGSLLNRISRKLSDSGLAAIITFRIVPVAPFSVINVIAGVSEMRLKDYAVGTFVGMLPGIGAIALLSDRISDSLRHPDLGQFMVLAMVVVLVSTGLSLLRRWIKRTREGRSS